MNSNETTSFYRPLLSFLSSKEALFLSYFLNLHRLDNDDWFLVTALEIQKATGLSKDQQLRIKKKLYELEVLKTKRRGIPAKNYYKIYGKKIWEKIND